MTKGLVGYGFCSNASLAYDGALFNYRVAGNGVFVTASRSHVKALIQISDHEVRGLDQIADEVSFDFPLVPCAIVKRMATSSCMEPFAKLSRLAFIELKFFVNAARPTCITIAWLGVRLLRGAALR